jgi:hypothetical protein
MRIVGTPPLRTAATRSGERGAPSADHSFANAVGNDAGARPAAAAAAMTSVEGLFALQEVADGLTGRRRAVARGKALLDKLDELRLALLSGAIPRARLYDLARMAREQGPLLDDPELAEVMAEIELRVAVELAKLGEPV